jgi:hypothetical protein
MTMRLSYVFLTFYDMTPGGMYTFVMTQYAHIQLGGWGRKDSEFKASLRNTEFEASLGDMLRPNLKK